MYAWEHPVAGKDAVRAEFVRQAPMWRDFRSEIVAMASDDRTVFMERHDSLLLGRRPLTQHAVAVFEVDDAGKIAAWRDYYDSMEFAVKLGADANKVSTAGARGYDASNVDRRWLRHDRLGKRFVEALDSHQGSRVADLMASEFRWEDLGAGLVFDNADVLVAFIGGCDAFSTDYRFTLVSEHVSETSYALEWEMAGTNTGTFRGRPATNRRYRIRGASIGRIDDDGRILENRDYYNAAELARQLGSP